MTRRRSAVGMWPPGTGFGPEAYISRLAARSPADRAPVSDVPGSAPEGLARHEGAGIGVDHRTFEANAVDTATVARGFNVRRIEDPIVNRCAIRSGGGVAAGPAPGKTRAVGSGTPGKIDVLQGERIGCRGVDDRPQEIRNGAPLLGMGRRQRSAGQQQTDDQEQPTRDSRAHGRGSPFDVRIQLAWLPRTIRGSSPLFSECQLWWKHFSLTLGIAWAGVQRP